MKNLFLLVLLTLIFYISKCHSQDDRWSWITDDNSGRSYNFDKKTCIINTDNVKLWVKIIHNPKDSIDYELWKWEIYFNTRRICEKEVYWYYLSGNYKNEFVNDCYEIIPESISEVFYDYFKSYTK